MPDELDALSPELLQHQVGYLHGLLSGPHRGLWEWHPDTGAQRAAGDIWQRIHGEPEQALSGIWTGDLNLVHPDERDGLLTLRDRLRLQGSFLDLSIRAYTRDRQPIWLRLWARAHRDARGRRFFVGGCVDYSESQLPRSQSFFGGDRFHAALEAVGDGLWEWDLRVDEIVLDRSCWKILGYTSTNREVDARAALGRWRRHIHPEDFPRLDQAMDDHVRDRLPLDVEFRVRHVEGSLVWVRCRGSMQTNSAGQPLRVVGTLQDITETRNRTQRLEEELQQLRRESGDRAGLLSSLSHELRTPLNAILGYTQLVELDHSLNPDQRHRLTEIRKAGQHLLQLIGDVMDLARIDSHHLAPSISALRPAELVADCNQLLEPLASTRKVNLIFEPLGWEQAYILADQVRFKQVVLNLVGNAIKYNREGGRVVVNFAPQAEGWLRLSILDTGRGIPAEKQAEAFEPFNRLGAEKGQIEGTGVGLAIARQLTEAMGGRIGFDSEEGQGSIFWIEFLMIDAPQEVMQLAARPDYASNLPACKLLYVSARKSAAERLKSLLSRYPQIEVQSVTDAMKGIFAARISTPDMVIYDSDIAGISASDFAAVLAGDASTAAIPQVVIGDRDIETQAVQLLTDYDLGDLAECLHAGLRRASAAGSDGSGCGGYKTAPAKNRNENRGS
nr:ATP-binding protein [Microbulbifer celer]